MALLCQRMPVNGQGRVRAVQITYHSGQVELEHQHDEHQLVFPSVGLLSVDTDSSRWIVPPLRAVWVPAHTPHAISALVDSKMSTLYIDTATSIPGLHGVTVVPVSPLLRELILHMINSSHTEAERIRLEAVLLDQLTADPSQPLQLPRLHDSRLQDIADIFERDPTDRRTLPQLGSEIGASERTLQRLFQNEIGQSFGRWRTQVRLQHSVIELGRGRSVTSAASRSGYSETSSFIEAFRYAFGTTPGRYFSQKGADQEWTTSQTAT